MFFKFLKSNCCLGLWGKEWVHELWTLLSRRSIQHHIQHVHVVGVCMGVLKNMCSAESPVKQKSRSLWTKVVSHFNRFTHHTNKGIILNTWLLECIKILVYNNSPWAFTSHNSCRPIRMNERLCYVENPMINILNHWVETLYNLNCRPITKYQAPRTDNVVTKFLHRTICTKIDTKNSWYSMNNNWRALYSVQRVTNALRQK